MPLKAHRPAPPPPVAQKPQQHRNINLNSNLRNAAANDSNNNRQSTIFSWPTVIRPAATTTTTTSTAKNIKKKPPPRPAPPKNYSGSKKSGDSLNSPTPDLLADLADVFSCPPPKTQGSTSRQSTFPFQTANQNNFPLNRLSSQPTFPFHPSSKKYPAPAPAKKEESLIDFETPVGTAHLTAKDAWVVASVANQNKALIASVASQNKPLIASVASQNRSLVGWNTVSQNSSSLATKKDLLGGNSPLACPAPVLTTSDVKRAVNSPAAGYVQKAAFSYGAQHKDTVVNWGVHNVKEHKDTVVNWGVQNVKEQVAVSKSFSPPEPKFPPPPPPPVQEEESFSQPAVLELCQVIYDFAAENPGDLSLRVGDRVEVEVKQNNDWWTGHCNGRRGIFPAAFVESLSVQPKDTCDSSSGCFAKALYTFQAEQPTDLAFQEGDMVEVLYRINQDWLFGKCAGQEGQFPAGFVTKDHSTSSQMVCCALYPFRAENSDELSFNEGDCIVIEEKSDGDWWKGRLEADPTARVGLFPANFVQLP